MPGDYLTGADGRAYAPDGVTHRNVIGDYGQPQPGDFYFYTEGSFEARLPVGRAVLAVVKGMEYRPVRVPVDAGSADRGTIDLRLERHANLPADGWFSGDIHVHMNLFNEKRIEPAYSGFPGSRFPYDYPQHSQSPRGGDWIEY